MIETSINQLTAAVVRLCDIIENKQIMLPLFGEQKAAPNATNPPEYVQKSARVLKPAKTKPEPTLKPEVPVEEPAPEPEAAPEVPVEEPTPQAGPQAEPESEQARTPDPEPTPTAPAITHETCTNLVKEYRRHNAHLLAAKKINHTEMLRIVNQRLGIEAVSKCPDDKLPALYDALKAICQPIEV